MRQQRQKNRFALILFSLLFMVSAIVTTAQSTTFTYQGRLTDGGTAANGNYDLQFALFDSVSGGTQIGTTQTVSNVGVSAGIFSVQLDFLGGAFTGPARFLEIGARLSGTQTFTLLAPRQQLTSTPYSIRSLNAASADAVTVSGVPGGSGNYIQNSSTPQPDSRFNISGNGTAGGTLSGAIVNASEFRLNGGRFLSVGDNSTYAGLTAGSGGSNNTFFGVASGAANGGGASANTYFGTSTGFANTTSGANSFFGYSSGALNTGEGNTFFGFFTGLANRAGSHNTLIGFDADVASANLSNATAIGAQATVGQSNALVLGSVAGVNGATSSVNVGIGTTTPEATLHVDGAAILRPIAGREVSIGTPNGETGIGIRGAGNRADARFDGTTLKLVASVGTGPPASTSGIAISTAGNVGIGTVAPSAKLEVNGLLKLIQIDTGFGEGSIHLCRNPANVIATCSSSSLRYKQQIAPFSVGLNLIRQLRPIDFTWKRDGSRDFGLAAEDVAKVEPRLVTHDDKGEVDGVKYDRLSLLLINAVKEQQMLIEDLRAANTALNKRLQTIERVIRTRGGRRRPRP